MTTATEMTANGKITAVRDNLVVFSPASTSYEMHLVCPGFMGPLNTPRRGVIRVKARKVYTVPSGGLFVTPIFGPPRIIQGRIRALDEKSMVLHAGDSITVEFPESDDAFDLVNGPLAVGKLANVVVFPGATFEPRQLGSVYQVNEDQPIDLRVLADFAAYALHFNLLAPANIVAWGDQLIAETELPPSWMIDLSLIETDPHAVGGVLRAVPGTPDLDKSLNLLSALVLREWSGGRLTIGQVRAIGWALYRIEFERNDFSQWGVVVEHLGEEFDNGFVPESRVREAIDEELAAFQSHVQQLPWWAQVAGDNEE